jgi:transcription elongation factor Elf1
MGKRKSSAKPPPKKARPKLETTFPCPICNAGKSVSCEMDRDINIGAVRCSQCKVTWTMKIHQLSEPIDVYRCMGMRGRNLQPQLHVLAGEAPLWQDGFGRHAAASSQRRQLYQ